MQRINFQVCLKSILLGLFLTGALKTSAQCSSVTPTFTLDLSGNPNSSSLTPSSSRNGTCCGGSIPCVKIVVLLNPNAMALQLTPTGADPGGALTYEFNCNGIQIPGGSKVCLSGTGPQTLTICKVGNNPNSYSVVSIPRPSVQDTLIVRNGCTQTLQATGYSVPTITWTAINAGTNTALYNSYLSCTTGCSLTVVSPTSTVPVPYIDYVVSGYGEAPCETGFYSDTARVFFYSDLMAPMSPTTICFGSVSAVLSPAASGGKPPYTYTWSTGSNSSSITVGPGNYTLTLADQTGCPPITSTVTVGHFTLPIQALTGADLARCKSSPNVVLNASVTSASGGTWSASSGTFLPSNAALSATYIPGGAAISGGSVQLILGTTGNQGCSPDADTLLITFEDPPSISAGPDMTVCANNSSTTFTATISGYPASPAWSSPDGGTLTTPMAFTTGFMPTAAQITAGSASVIVSTTNNGACGGNADTVRVIITPAPVVNAGADVTICSNGSAALAGTVSGGATTGTWSTLGDGVFSNPASLATSYTPGSSDISTGTTTLVLSSTNNGNCLVVRDTLILLTDQLAQVAVSSPSQICTISPGTTVNGTITGATTTGSWISSGSGSFSNPTALNTTYVLSGTDQSAGTLTFSLVSTNNGACPAVTNTIAISIMPLPTVTAGSNYAICSSQNTISLVAGSPSIISGPSTGTWNTTGTGTFIGSGTYSNSIYQISAADILNGLLNFTLTSTNNGVCPSITDSVQITIIKYPHVFAGANLPVCSVQGSVALSGTVTGGLANAGLWSSSGSGTFNPGAGSLNTSYALSPADILNGSVIFTLSSSNNGPCFSNTDSVMITVVPLATVDAGVNRAICTSQPNILLGVGQATISGNSQGGVWSSSGSGTLNSPSNYTNSSYSFSGNDIQLSTVIFTLSSLNNGVCPVVTDTVMMKLVRTVSVSAGANQPVCSSAGNISLSGTVAGGTGAGIGWNSSGSGTFNPGPGSLNTQYALSAGDVQTGFVTFTISSVNNGPCATQIDTARIRVFKTATVNAGTNQVICSTKPLISLNGNVNSTFNSGTWSSTGTGAFSTPNGPVVTYTITQQDISAGVLTFSLSSTNNGPCNAVNSAMQVQIIRQASVVAGPSRSVCSSDATVALTGTITGGTSSVAWSSNGNGSFIPAGTALATNYIISANDITNGSAILNLSSTANGPCAVATSTLMLHIQTPSQANPGTYQPVCSSAGTINLNGNVAGGKNTGIWSTTGSGSFVPVNSALNAGYVLSAGDIQLGSVTLILTSTDNAACPSHSQQVSIPVIEQVTVLAMPDFSVCSSHLNIPLTATLGGKADGTNWTTAGSGTITAPPLLQTSYNLSPGDVASGTILFYITGSAVAPCAAVTDTAEMHITLRPEVHLANDTSICANQNPLQLTGEIDNGSGSILWVTTGNGEFLPGNYVKDVAYQLSEQDIFAGFVNLSLNSVNNGACGEISSTIRVEIKPVPEAIFSVSASTIELPGPAIVFNNESVGASQYTWQVSDGEVANTKHLTKAFESVGFYTVTLLTENQFACRDSVDQVITVIKSVKFPTAFSPNGDRLNDEFRPITDGVVKYEMLIFNRWGELIFRSDDISRGWDGSFKGEPCQQDVYVWKAVINFFDGRVFDGTGSITLLK